MDQHYEFFVYDNIKNPMPAKVRAALRTHFQMSENVQDKERKHICRGGVPGEYMRGALQVSHIVAVGIHDSQIVAVILALRPTLISPWTNKPICLDHEWYIDVVCSYYCFRGCGAHTMHQFMQYAEKQGVRALRLYATKGSLPAWRDHWGFREAETYVDRHGNCKYGPISSHSYPGEKPGHQTYRMTRILAPTDSIASRTRAARKKKSN